MMRRWNTLIMSGAAVQGPNDCVFLLDMCDETEL